MQMREGLRAGLCAGPAVGAWVGLLDCARAAVEGDTLLTARHFLSATASYAACWIPLSLLAGLVAGALPRAERAAVLLAVVGSITFAAGAWANVVVLPSFTAPASLRFDAILLAVAAVVFVALYRLPVPVPGASPRGWGAVLLVALFVAFAARFFAEGEPAQRVDVKAAPGPRPGVLVVLADSLRADHVSALGYHRKTTPRIDRFAEHGVLLANFRAAATWTKPATASLLTGLLPSAHRAVEHRAVLAPAAVTLAEVYREAGYRTAAFSDNPFISPEFGFGQGFQSFDGLSPSPFVNGTLLGKALWTARVLSIDARFMGSRLPEGRGTADLAARFLSWLDRTDAARPFFAYVHGMEPHVPYTPPERFKGRFADRSYAGPEHPYPPRYQGMLPFEKAPGLPEAERQHMIDRYDEEIAAFDDAFGRLVDGLAGRGLLESTIVVVLADHGEEFHEHGGWTHGHSLYEELVRVPLLIRAPGLAPGRRDFPARATDLYATLLSLSGLAADAPPFGLDLAEAIRSGVPPFEAPVVSEVAFGGAGAEAIVLGDRKAIRARRGDEREDLSFDLSKDPREVSPLPTETWVKGLHEKLTDVLRAAWAMALREDARRLSPAEEERLRGFGYFR